MFFFQPSTSPSKTTSIKIDEKVTSIYKQIEALEAEAKTFLQKSQHSKGSAKDMYKQKCLMALKKKKAL